MSPEGASQQRDDSIVQTVAGRFQDAWNAHDVDRVAQIFTEDAVLEDPGAPDGLVRGQAAIGAYFGSYQRAFPDTEMRQEVQFRPLTGGGEYASRWRVWGTMHAHLEPPGFAATHRRVETEGVSVIELRGELVSRCRQFYDTTEVARQLGAAPPRGSRLERFGVLMQRISVTARARARRR
jgi:steroid delta-isomerase-like uncharacterized protein